MAAASKTCFAAFTLLRFLCLDCVANPKPKLFPTVEIEAVEPSYCSGHVNNGYKGHVQLVQV